MSIHLGIDGGGTTTRAVVIDEHRNVLATAEAGSSNHYSVGLDQAVSNIDIASRRALELAGRTADTWGLGLAGACTATEQALLSQRLRPLCGTCRLVVDEDAAAAQRGAFDGGAGVVSIAGTGANHYGITDDGRRGRADGLGPLLGDRGSGYWIGEAALRAVGKACDGSGPETALSERVLLSLQVASMDGLVQLVYRADFGKDRVAALVPVVLNCAGEDDGVAIQLLNAAGHELADGAAAVLSSLGLSKVAVSGGVLSRSSPVRDAFESSLQQALGPVQVGLPLYEAAIGAALLALQ